MKSFIRLVAIGCCLLSALFGDVEESVLTAMDGVYSRQFEKKVNKQQKEAMQYAAACQDTKLRVMTYNMLYNAPEAETMLPAQHRWECRKSRLLHYLQFADVDIIGSQELQKDQVQDVMDILGSHYGCYGQITRVNEGRSDVNAIFYRKNRVDLIDSVTILYEDDHYENAFTYCRFKDKVLEKTFVTINTKLTWGDVDVFTHGIDTAKVDGEYPSDHFPVVADLFFKAYDPILLRDGIL